MFIIITTTIHKGASKQRANYILLLPCVSCLINCFFTYVCKKAWQKMQSQKTEDIGFGNNVMKSKNMVEPFSLFWTNRPLQCGTNGIAYFFFPIALYINFCFCNNNTFLIRPPLHYDPSNKKRHYFIIINGVIV